MIMENNDMIQGNCYVMTSWAESVYLEVFIGPAEWPFESSMNRTELFIYKKPWRDP